MRIKMSFKHRLLTAFSILFNKKLTRDTKALYCPKCKGNRFITLLVKERNLVFEYEYKCVKCGAKVQCKEIWKY